MQASLDVGAGLGRAALVGGQGAVASQRPLGFHNFGLRLVRKDLEQGRGAREQGRAKGGGLCRGAGVTLSPTEVPIRVHVRGAEVPRIQVVSRVTAFAWSLPLGVWGGDGTGELAVEQRLFTASVGAFLEGRKAI